MKTRTIPTGLLALGLGLMASPPVSAMPPLARPDAPMVHPGPMACDFDPFPPFLHGLQLNEEQNDKVFNLMHAQVPTLRAKAKEARRAHEELQRLSLSVDFDEAKAKSLADAGARAMADMALMRARADQQIYRLLSPEQRRALASRPIMPSGDGSVPARQ
jgi:Spy/CpxP family protein refolding chaperone